MRPLALLTVLLPAAALAAAPARDEWARVPAFPTGCYQSRDDFGKKLEAADESATRDLSQQRQINQEMQEKIKTIDPMELASRQQQYMMDHPQEAMALMQRNGVLGETLTDAGLETKADREKLDQELKDIDARYRAALDKVLGPIEKRFKDLDARAQKELVPIGEMWGYPAWASKEWAALIVEENAAYERECPNWWGAAGPYHVWLKRYRAHLIEGIPIAEEAENVGAGFMVQLVGSPTRAFKPVATLDAVGKYMDRAAEVFEKRWDEPDSRREGAIGQ